MFRKRPEKPKFGPKWGKNYKNKLSKCRGQRRKASKQTTNSFKCDCAPVLIYFES